MSRERIKRELSSVQEIKIDPYGFSFSPATRKVVEEGNYYGALQMYNYKSIRVQGGCTSFEFGIHTKALEHFREYTDPDKSLLKELEYLQVNCGADLALLFVDTLVKAKSPSNSWLVQTVPVPPHLGDVSDDEDLQNLQEPLGEARSRVENLTSFLRVAIKVSYVVLDILSLHATSQCYPGEDDLAIARSVLMYLSMGNMKPANFMMDEIKRQKLPNFQN
ncbi:unnamed protein product [Thlaspi arvense]|uniref:Uncharacterized protein n=1 Tax=Thlaspi arvense TaxID=13288 RepID=A0AAU9SY99_THLAR|nr:unnamed protein product [Thlaspi arvense]